MVNLRTGATKNWAWVSKQSSILSEIGTLQLEFEYLAQITGERRFADPVRRLSRYMARVVPETGLCPTYLHPDTGVWATGDTTVGALGDSYFEYLLKVPIYGNRTSNIDADAVPGFGRGAFDSAMDAIQKQLYKASPLANRYIAEIKSGKTVDKMGHLACFMGGLYSLGAQGLPSTADARARADRYLQNAVEITETCRKSYARTPTGTRKPFSGSGYLRVIAIQ